MAETPKYPIHAYLSKAGRTGWQQVCDEHGVSMTGLLESVGLIMGGCVDESLGLKGGNSGTGLNAGVIAKIIPIARKIDARRRQRGAL